MISGNGIFANCIFEEKFISPSFFKRNMNGFRIPDWHIFAYLHCLQWKVCRHPDLYFSVAFESAFSICSKICYLLLFLNNLIIMWLGIFLFMFLVLGVHWASWICNLGNFQPLSLQILLFFFLSSVTGT